MKKFNSYFPHDSNAKDDPKCVLLIEQLGMEGYGIYWMLVETLREQPNYRYPLTLLSALARRYNTTTEKVKAVVCSYNLFIVEESEFFFSNSLIERMKPLEEKRLIAVKAGKASAIKRKSNTSSTGVQHTFNDGSTSKVNKSKVNKSKVNKSKLEIENNIISNEKSTRFYPPTLEEVQKYISEKKYSVNASNFINFYTSKGWMIGRNKMKDWQAAVRTWGQKENTQHRASSEIGVVLKNNDASKYDNDKLW